VRLKHFLAVPVPVPVPRVSILNVALFMLQARNLQSERGSSFLSFILMSFIQNMPTA
jgi:hypothetical protein